jgi:hypothetical protein
MTHKRCITSSRIPLVWFNPELSKNISGAHFNCYMVYLRFITWSFPFHHANGDIINGDNADKFRNPVSTSSRSIYKTTVFAALSPTKGVYIVKNVSLG